MNRCLALVLLALALAACGDNLSAADQPDAASDAEPGPREVTLRFRPQVADAEFACGRTYPKMGVEDTTISPRDFRLYVHDVKLIAADGARVPLVLAQDGAWQHRDVALLDFEDGAGACQDGTPETNTAIRGTAPGGAYRGVELTVGIPAALNHADLTTLPAPLNVTGLWWSWRFGHLFLAIATHAELAAPAPGANDHYFHLGSIGCTGDPAMGQQVACARPNRARVELTGFDPLVQPIVADFGAVLAMSKLATSVGCHSFAQEPCAWPFDLVGLNWFTGSQTPTTQRLFRVAP